MMDKETIIKARQADLAKYLLSIGVPLIRNGKRYKHKDHDSLIFTENAYYWNSQQEHGNAIDYLVKHMDMDFKTAVFALANMPTSAFINEPKTKIFELDKIALSQDTNNIKQYLNKTRFVSYEIINYLIAKKLLFQEECTNNALFPMYDEENNCVGAELQGITKKRFKGIKSGSKYGYGFNIRYGDSFDYALFFESAIDLISFIDYKQNYENKSLDKCILISMSGLKPNIVKHSLKAFKGNPKTVLCIDNDMAGENFKQELQIPYIDISSEKHFKDWNDLLKSVKTKNKPIERLMQQYKR